MTTPAELDGAEIERVGPRPDAYHNEEIPEHRWTTCTGCPAFRVHDWHYFYCRYLGDQKQPDRWWEGWRRVERVHNEQRPAECGLPTIAHLARTGHPVAGGGAKHGGEE